MTIASRLRTVGAKATTIAVALAAAFGSQLPPRTQPTATFCAQITPAPVNGTLWGSGSSAVTFGPRP